MTVPHFYAQAPFFEKLNPPSTDPKAKPSEFVEVKNQRVISVVSGTYRNAVVSGIFLLASTNHQYQGKSPEHQEIEVYCLWFGARLKKGAPRFKIKLNNFSIQENYSGKAVANISRKY